MSRVRLFLTPLPEVRPAQSIANGGHFVDLPTRRLAESQASAAFLGIEADYYDDLPDGKLGKLNAPYYSHIMGTKLVSLLTKYDITAIATAGADGFCGHNDHIITHRAALAAQAILFHEHGLSIPVLALKSDGNGELAIPVQRQRKLTALGYHATQMPVTATGELAPSFFVAHPHYRSLLEQETYDILLPGVTGSTTRHSPSPTTETSSSTTRTAH